MSSVRLEKKDFSAELPSWFKPDPGFKFRDEDGDACIVIGWGGSRDVETVSEESELLGRITGFKLKMNPCALLIAYNYKGEWHLHRLIAFSDWYQVAGQPGWSEDQEKQLSGWK